MWFMMPSPYSALIRAGNKIEQREQALPFCAAWGQQGLVPDDSADSALIKACNKDKQLEQAVEFFLQPWSSKSWFTLRAPTVP